MLEAVIGGIIGALVGAAGSYVVQRRLEAKRREEETLEWMLSKLSALHSEMNGVHFLGIVFTESISEKTTEIERLAESIKGRVQEIQDKELRKDIYQMFEEHYKDDEAMLSAVKDIKVKLYRMIRRDLMEVREELHRDAMPSTVGEKLTADKHDTWQMPPKYGWRSKVTEMLKQEKAEVEQQQSASSPGSES